MLRRRLILSADYERCVFPDFFRLIVYIFVSPSTLPPGFQLRFIIFSPLLCLLFSIHVFAILQVSGLPNTVSLRSHY